MMMNRGQGARRAGLGRKGQDCGGRRRQQPCSATRASTVTPLLRCAGIVSRIPFPPLPRRVVCLASRQSVYKVSKLDNHAFSLYFG